MRRGIRSFACITVDQVCGVCELGSAKIAARARVEGFRATEIGALARAEAFRAAEIEALASAEAYRATEIGAEICTGRFLGWRMGGAMGFFAFASANFLARPAAG